LVSNKGGNGMNLRKLIFTECDAYKAGRKITPKGIMVHSTGANNPNLKRYVGPDDGLLGRNTNNNHWNMPGVGASVHAFVGKLKDGSIATYQVLPWDYRAGHCGSSANNTHIAFEICEDNLKDAEYFKKVYKEAVELTAMLCKQYNLDPMADGVVICHSEGYKKGVASNHGDVMHWFPKHGKSMDTFRADVKALLVEKPVAKKSVCNVELPVLTKGDKGEAVKAMQILLIGHGYRLGDSGATGKYGDVTEKALLAFKKDRGLAASNKCGALTWTTLLGA
jgi:hypothetical protein